MITILGAGNGGLAIASYLLSKKYYFILWNRSHKRLETIIKNKNNLKIIDNHGSVSKMNIPSISFNLEESIRKSKIILIITPGIAHKELAEKTAPFLSSDHIVILMPGRTLGSTLFKKTVNKLANTSIECFETQTILHTCRAEKDKLYLYAKKPIVSYSSEKIANKENINLVNSIFSEFVYVDNYYSVTLNNIGAMLHPIPTLLNSGRIEMKQSFKYYTEGLSPSIAKFIERVDKERKELCNRIKCEYISVTSWLKNQYGSKSNNLYQAIREVRAYKDILAPTTLDHRYIYDDICTGLVPIFYLGKKYGLKMYNTKSFIDFASAFFNTDFLQNGRKIEV